MPRVRPVGERTVRKGAEGVCNLRCTGTHHRTHGMEHRSRRRSGMGGRSYLPGGIFNLCFQIPDECRCLRDDALSQERKKKPQEAQEIGATFLGLLRFLWFLPLRTEGWMPGAPAVPTAIRF